MKFLLHLIVMVLLASSLFAADCPASSGALAPTNALTKTALPETPEQNAVEAFSNHAEWDVSDDGEGKSLVSDRILDGFEAAPSLLVTAGGSSVRWGFEYQEGRVESVIISNASGEMKLLAAVDGISRLTSRSSSPISSMEEYAHRQKRSGMDPAVTVFVHEERDLKAYLPLLKRWLQANFMGFNTDCSKLNLGGACRLAEQIAIPTRIYVIAADGGLRIIKTPDVKASLVLLKSFIQ